LDQIVRLVVAGTVAVSEAGLVRVVGRHDDGAQSARAAVEAMSQHRWNPAARRQVHLDRLHARSSVRDSIFPKPLVLALTTIR
jgi:hypothetical protein